MTSRNQREGCYAGRFEGRHLRAHRPETTVWEGDEVLMVYPIPSSGVAWGVLFCRSIREPCDDES